MRDGNALPQPGLADRQVSDRARHKCRPNRTGSGRDPIHREDASNASKQKEHHASVVLRRANARGFRLTFSGRTFSPILLESKGNQRPSGGDDDVLFAFEFVTHRSARDCCAGLEIPQRLSGRRIQREDIALGGSSEQ